AYHLMKAVVARSGNGKVEGPEILAQRISTNVFDPWPQAERCTLPLGHGDLQQRKALEELHQSVEQRDEVAVCSGAELYQDSRARGVEPQLRAGPCPVEQLVGFEQSDGRHQARLPAKGSGNAGVPLAGQIGRFDDEIAPAGIVEEPA